MPSEFHKFFVSAQERNENQGFSLDLPRLHQSSPTDATLLLQPMKNIFEWEFFSHFWTFSFQISSRDSLPKIDGVWTAVFNSS